MDVKINKKMNKIKSIYCKYCNKKLGSATQRCYCKNSNRVKWNNPNRERKLKRINSKYSQKINNAHGLNSLFSMYKPMVVLSKA